MSSYPRRRACSLAGLFATSVLYAATALAGDAPAPGYTYLGAGYEWGDSRCAIQPNSGNLSGYTVEGSVGLLNFLHLTGTYYDGDGSWTVDAEPDPVTSGINVKCYEVGAGLSYSFAPGADVVLRGNYVKVESDDVSGGDGDGFEPQLLVRYMMSDKAEIEVGMTYFDINLDAGDSISNTEIRVGVAYHVLPWLAVRVGGSVFDDDSSINAGVRAYFGGNLF